MPGVKFILIGGYPHKAADGGKALCAEMVRGFAEPVKLLDCLFARPKDNWELAHRQDQEFFTNNLPGTKLEIAMAVPENFTQQVAWADLLYIRGGACEPLLVEFLSQNLDWFKALQGKTFAGSSAGADAVCKYYYDLDNVKTAQGLGLLPLKILVHYQSDYNAEHMDWRRAEAELRACQPEDLEIVKLREGEFKVIEFN